MPCFWRSGACAREFDLFCATSMPGLGRFASCLSSRLAEEENGNVEGDSGQRPHIPPFSPLPYPTNLSCTRFGLALPSQPSTVRLCVAGKARPQDLSDIVLLAPAVNSRNCRSRSPAMTLQHCSAQRMWEAVRAADALSAPVPQCMR